VAAAVIEYMIDEHICINVHSVSKSAKRILYGWKKKYPELVREVRGEGLLLAVEFTRKEYVSYIQSKSLESGLILNIKHGTIIRLIPALTVAGEEMFKGLKIIENCMFSFSAAGKQ
jgi:acetylornithine/succinyldiaminopimelate/putrescine aminotransferase